MSQFSDSDGLFSLEVKQEHFQKASSSKRSSTSEQSSTETKESKQPKFNINEKQFTSANYRDLKKGLFNLPKSDLVWILKWLKYTNNYEGSVNQISFQQIQTVLKEHSEVIIRDLVPLLQVDRVSQTKVEEDSQNDKPEHACDDTVFQNRRITLEELRAQQNVCKLNYQAAQIKELVSQLEECQKENDKLKKEVEILKKKSSNDFIFSKLKEISIVAENNMREMRKWINMLPEKDVFLTFGKTNIPIYEKVRNALMEGKQPQVVLVKLLSILKQHNLLQDQSKGLLIMPGDKQNDGTRISCEHRDELVQFAETYCIGIKGAVSVNLGKALREVTGGEEYKKRKTPSKESQAKKKQIVENESQFEK